MHEPIVVVGGGFGGLSAAVELARRGERVLLLEREAEVGGKARSVTVAGHRIDVGPTVLTMRWVFDELFEACGRRLEDTLRLIPLEVLSRNAFADGTRLDLYTDVERSADAIGALAGAKEAAAYRRFAAYGEAIARLVEEPFLRSARPTVASLALGAKRLGPMSLARIDAHRTMWKAIGSFFADARLRALFGRYATYVGSSPFEAPATLNLVAHYEREGVAVVEGGLSRLAKALADLARSLGVEIRTGCAVRDILAERGRATSVVVEAESGDREVIEARAVVVNADVATLAAGFLGTCAAEAVGKRSRAPRSLSAVTMAIAGTTSGFELDHHTVFFSNDYPDEHRALFDQRRLPEDPTVYVCAQDRAPGSRLAAGSTERLFVIANAPANAAGAVLTPLEIERCERNISARLSKAGLRLSPVETQLSTPTTFERLAPGTGGAIYGEACHGALAPLLRPSSRTKLPRLYLAGGSVHPGPGVPMAALSGRLAALAVIEDLASTMPSPRAAIAGSTSMPSATTGSRPSSSSHS